MLNFLDSKLPSTLVQVNFAIKILVTILVYEETSISYADVLSLWEISRCSVCVRAHVSAESQSR